MREIRGQSVRCSEFDIREMYDNKLQRSGLQSVFDPGGSSGQRTPWQCRSRAVSGFGRPRRRPRQPEEVFVSGQENAGRGIHGGRSQKLIYRPAVAPHRLGFSGPPLRSRASLCDGITTRQLEGRRDHETGTAGFHLGNAARWSEIGEGANVAADLTDHRVPILLLSGNQFQCEAGVDE